MGKKPQWEAVIGLEIHAELNTESKLFSGARNRFGDEPNRNIDALSTGQPGSLPVLNRAAVEKAIRFGCAIEGHVQRYSAFDRKSYFYPDSPRNFQITQFRHPIILGGKIIAEVEGSEQLFEIERAHLEDDAGMLKHFSTFAGVDFNRAGVPLLEIVSKPCMHCPKEAVAYAMAVKSILQYVDASDCNMEEGSLRIDANISVRNVGESSLRHKTEIKNMNSFRDLEKAIRAEIRRQIHLYEAHGGGAGVEEVIAQATYRYDPQKNDVVLMRRKESARDYRYLPEPDLPPLILSEVQIETIRSQLPELPLERQRRYVQQFDLHPDAAFTLVSDRGQADYFEEAMHYTDQGKTLCNWILVEFTGRLREMGKELVSSKIPPREVAELVNGIHSGTITGKIAKSVADELVKDPKRRVEEIIAGNPNYTPLYEDDLIAPIVDAVLAANPEAVADYRAGRTKALAALVGQVMKATQGKASPRVVNALLIDRLEEE